MDDPIELNSADQEAIDAIEELQGHGPEIVRYARRARRLFDLRRLDEAPAHR